MPEGKHTTEASSTRKPFDFSLVQQQTLQAGSELAHHRQKNTALADACKGEIAKTLAGENVMGKMALLGNQIEQLIPPERQLHHQITTGLCLIRSMNSLLEVERESRERLAEMLNPCSSAVSRLCMPTSGVQLIAEASTDSLRRIAEATAPRIASMDFGRGWDAISSMDCGMGRDAIASHELVGKFAALTAAADLLVPVRIHAVPCQPPQSAPRPGRCREAFLDSLLLSPVPELLSHPEPTGWLDDSLDEEGGRMVLEQLNRFVRSEEIPNDAPEGMDFLFALWKLKRPGLSQAEGRQLNLKVQDFLRRQLDLMPPAGGHRLLESGLFVPHLQGENPSPVPAPDLAPEKFTTHQLSKKLPSTPDTLKRHAKRACDTGPLPQPMPAFPGWFVVSQSDPRGGHGCGWKFQQRNESKKS